MTSLYWMHCFLYVLNQKFLWLFFPLRTLWFILVSGYIRTFLLMLSSMKETQALPATSSHPAPEAIFLWQDASLRRRLRVQNTILVTLLEWPSPPQVPLSGKEGGPAVGLWRKRSPASLLGRKMREANRSVSGLHKCRLFKKNKNKWINCYVFHRGKHQLGHCTNAFPVGRRSWITHRPRAWTWAQFCSPTCPTPSRCAHPVRKTCPSATDTCWPTRRSSLTGRLGPNLSRYATMQS